MTHPSVPNGLPAWARIVVRLVTPRDRRAGVEGDLAELRAARLAMGRRDIRRALAGDLQSLVRAALQRKIRSIAGGGAGCGADLRVALRAMRRAPGYAALAAATLALGIASATTVFSIGDRVLLRPLPYPQPERLFAIDHAPYAFSATNGAMVISKRVREMPELAGAASYVTGGFNVGGDGAATRVAAAAVTPAFFTAMGVTPLYGRVFSDDDERASAHVAIVSHALWRARLGGARDLVGSPLLLNGVSFQVVGIMPERFAFPAGADVWTPTMADRQMAGQATAPESIARLASNISPAQAQAALDRVDKAFGGSDPERVPRLRSLHTELTAGVRPVLILLTSAVGVLLLVTCGNVSGLALSRLVMRHRELVLRRALGASSARLMRLVTVEAACVTAAGALAGVPASFWLTRAAAALSPVALPEFDLARVDLRMLAVAMLIAAGCGLVVVLAPALAATRAEAAGVVRASATSTSRSTWWRSALVTGQVAAAIVLIVAAMGTWTTLRGLLDIDPGVHPSSSVHVAEITLPLARYADGAAVERFFTQLAPEMQSRGVARVAAASFYPGSPAMGIGYRLVPADAPPPPDAPPIVASWLSVSERYFDVLGMPIEQGRGFSPADRRGTPLVGIVSKETARALYPDAASPVGRHFAMMAGKTTLGIYEIIGVTRDTNFRGPRQKSRGAFYVSFAQQGAFGGFSLLFDPSSVSASAARRDPAATLRDALSSVDAGVPPYGVRRLQSVIDAFLARERLSMFVCAAFAVMTIVLVTIGLYGVLAQSVARRTREIGLRLALGANRARVQWIVIRDGQALIVTGIACGLVAAWLLMKTLTTVVPDLTVPRASAFAMPVALMLAVGMLAAWLPARRAARTDPLTALKEM